MVDASAHADGHVVSDDGRDEPGTMVPETRLGIPYADVLVYRLCGCADGGLLIWGRYRKKGFRTVLPLSFQFHHTQMDGMEAAQFLNRLQKEMQTFSSKTKGTKKQV